jgi:two-component system response regulator AlgR
MKVLIVDDEPLARQRLVRFLETMPQVLTVLEAENGLVAINQVTRHQPDLLLLDIRMPEMDGLQVAAHLSELVEPPAIIFCSAFEEHALEAIKVQAIDYLLKPVRLSELEQAISRAKKINRVQASQLVAAESEGGIRSHLSIHSHRGIELVSLEAVVFFRAEQKYIQVMTAEHEYLIDEPLKKLEDEFHHGFVRVHRNALVAKKAIERLDKDSEGQTQLWLRGVATPLVVSRRHLAQVKKVIKHL